MNTVTKAAARATRIVCGGRADLRYKSRRAHRANRRAARQACRAASLVVGDDVEVFDDIRDTHVVDARDIA